MSDDLRNFCSLFNSPNRNVKIDLFSFNVQRGKDYGTCSLNQVRQRVGLTKKQQFNQLISDSNKADAMQKLYQKIDKIYLWPGILGQPNISGSVLGQLGIRITAIQLRMLRNADSLWYQNIFPQPIIKQIKATTFSDIIQRNTGVKNIGRQAFKVSSKF